MAQTAIRVLEARSANEFGTTAELWREGNRWRMVWWEEAFSANPGRRHSRIVWTAAEAEQIKSELNEADSNGN